MSRSHRPTVGLLALFLLLALGAAGCGRRDRDAERDRRVDRAVESSLQATGTAEAAFDATVAASVAGTATALAAETATPVGREVEGASPAGTVVVTTLATPLATADIASMGEAELAAAVEAAVAAAMAAAEAAGEAGSAAAEDGRVDPGESLLVEIEIAGAEDWLDEAERLLEAHAERYGELAEETRRSVEDLELQLEDIAAALIALEAWASAAEARATEVAGEVQDALATARARATERSQRFTDWRQSSQATLEALRDTVRRTPRSRPADLAEALRKLGDFGEALRQGLDDGEIDAVEREVLAELGAEAAAGLREHGGPLLQRLAEEVDRSLEAIEAGDWDALRERLRSLESARS